MDREKIEKTLFYASLITITLLFLYLLKYFFYPIFWAAIIASIFRPIHNKLNNKLHNMGISAGITILLILFVIMSARGIYRQSPLSGIGPVVRFFKRRQCRHGRQL